MNQRELADRIGVTPGAVCRWVNGTRVPTLDLMDRIADVFDWPVCDQVADRRAYAVALANKMGDDDE